VKNYIVFGIILVCLVVNTAGCTGTTVTETVATTLPAETKTVTVTTTNNVTATATSIVTTTAATTNTITTTATNTVTVTSTNIATVTATTTATATTTSTITTIITSTLPTTPTTTTTPNAAPVGTTLEGIMVIWVNLEAPGYGNMESYNVKVTILEIVRGEKAWEQIKAADTSNKPPNAGFEYILARIRFGYYAKGSGNTPYTMKPGDFTALSADKRGYEIPSTVPPKPELIGRVFSPGDSYEGWVPFLVAKNDNKPLMLYAPVVMWFQLY
jgi:hypothetical protein